MFIYVASIVDLDRRSRLRGVEDTHKVFDSMTPNIENPDYSSKRESTSRKKETKAKLSQRLLQQQYTRRSV